MIQNHRSHEKKTIPEEFVRKNGGNKGVRETKTNQNRLIFITHTNKLTTSNESLLTHWPSLGAMTSGKIIRQSQ